MMGYEYIAIVASRGLPPERPIPGTEAASLLDGDRLIPHALSPGIVVYVKRTARPLRLPHGGLLIGHLFSRSCDQITDASRLPDTADARSLRRLLIERYWGDYVLFLGDADHFSATRDPSGGVNLLHFMNGDAAILTSDIGLAIRLGLYRKSTDWSYISHRLVFPSLKTTRTGLMGVRELLPGCTLTVRSGETRVSQDWSPWKFVEPARRQGTAEEAAASVRSAITGVIQGWTKVDRDILLELSGGLDSSIVGACLQDSGARVACCTITTPVPGADERMYARPVADLLGAELEAVGLDVRSSEFDFLQTADIATPRIGVLHHATDRIMEAAAERHEATSFYSGGGGDSIFCYLPTAAPAADALRERGASAGLQSIRDLAELHQCTLWTAGRLAIRKLLRPAQLPWRTDSLFLSRQMDCTPETHPWFDAPRQAFQGDRERIFGLATTQVYRDSAARGRRRHLRLPLLSQPVMEACLGVPSWMWIGHGRNRAIARAAFADLLPPEVLNRRSKGTFRPFLGAFYVENKRRIQDFLRGGQLQSHGMLDAEALAGFFDSPLPPRDHAFSRVLDLCATENWLRHHS
ncbi:asparagine synthase-related protein [Luteimonas sp. SDU101]|uniref:asparagine synthase-related protein n=1 Tax=Luteimonas sp. SDU101 TaxID=3422593 RepID=UPI003EBC97EA